MNSPGTAETVQTTKPAVDSQTSQTKPAAYSAKTKIGLVLGPVVALAIWFAPMKIAPNPKHALAITAFMVIYWMFEPIDYGLTGLAGCFLYWALHVTSFATAFSGFADNTPWFLFGTLILGEAAARTGLASRIGYGIMGVMGTSYSRLLLSVIILVFILNFLVPSGLAQLAIVAPMLLGVMAVFGVGKGSNIGRGMFIILSYTCGLFNKAILAGGASVLTRGLVEKMTGHAISWDQFFVAYLPVDPLTILACWLTILWLYPPEKKELPGGRKFMKDKLHELGPWTANQKKTLFWLLFAIVIWATDALHGINPAVVALGVGLAVTMPVIGVLTKKDVTSINFLLIIFMGTVLGMGSVLIQTKALDTLTSVAMSVMAPMLGHTFRGATALYWTGIVYHFALASELSMLSTGLPVIINFAQAHGYNPTTAALLWNFASGGKMFVYQSAVLMFGYGFGYFESKDMLKVGAVLTVVEGILVMIIVPLYWPLIGLHWLLR